MTPSPSPGAVQEQPPTPTPAEGFALGVSEMLFQLRQQFGWKGGETEVRWAEMPQLVPGFSRVDGREDVGIETSFLRTQLVLAAGSFHVSYQS